jgi:hypothetical protein
MPRALRTLELLIGFVSLAIVLDYYLFNGYCCQATGKVLSNASDLLLSDLQQFLAFSPNQLIHQIFWG